MKSSHMITNRFRSPSIMTTETRVLGCSVAEWQETFTGGFRRTFAELEEAQRIYSQGTLRSDGCLPPPTVV